MTDRGRRNEPSLCYQPAATSRDNHTPSRLAAAMYILQKIDIDPAPASMAIANLLLLAAFVMIWAGIRARRLEIGYGTE